ncbi:MAG: hypothetical protein P8O16_02290 [Algoriphagus sp.]|jgi:tRNA(His) 5'-end guanylyltransferase|uniref:hypothetical protein n=1 Tax=Algoriphagus sp. TaxID=1872435 RepID=UPI00261DA1B0|nr:hypothetical protein [Algoriphagus sp.]MDG1276081.1 hypothetical protein [Algoriphagus sp.]
MKAIEEFLNSDLINENASPILLALWYDGNGDWKKAHDQVDQLEGKDAARIHAYLHRKEGDQWNAEYWYRRAGVAVYQGTLEEEWENLLNDYLGK